MVSMCRKGGGFEHWSWRMALVEGKNLPRESRAALVI